MRLLLGVTVAAVAPFLSARAATPVAETYPSLAGASASSSGSVRATGGATRTYTITNPGLDSQLYFGPLDPTLNGGVFPISSGLDGTLSAMSFLSDTGNTAIWQGTTTYDYSLNGGATFQTTSVATEFVMTVTGGGSMVSAAGVGISNGVGEVVDISGSSSFTVNEQFLALDPNGSGYQSFDTVYNGLVHAACSGCEVSSFAGGFYSVAAPVPEPASLALLGTAIVGLGALRRRRTSR